MDDTNLDVVESLAYKFINYSNFPNANVFVEKLNLELAKFNKELDKLKYINIVSIYLKEKHDEHLSTCKNENPGNCGTSKKYYQNNFFLTQMLEEYGIGIDEKNIFSMEERNELNAKLDDILEEIEKLKTGQEITYDDLQREIEELKNLYFIGKKNWYQNLAGKSMEMVASGVVGEIAAKPIATQLLSLAGKTFGNLLG